MSEQELPWDGPGRPLCDAVARLRQLPEIDADDSGYHTFEVSESKLLTVYYLLQDGPLASLLIDPGVSVGELFINGPSPRLDKIRIKEPPDWIMVRFLPSVINPSLYLTLGYEHDFEGYDEEGGYGEFGGHTARAMVAVGAEIAEGCVFASREVEVHTAGGIVPHIGGRIREGDIDDNQSLLAIAEEILRV